MPLPKMTDEQRAAALEKAKEARAKRAKLKEDIKSGKLTLTKVLNSDDEITKKTKVLQILVSLPGVGKVTAQKAMEEIGIAENRRIGGLGSAQKEKLIERFGIDTIPTLMLFKSGEVIGSVVAPGSKAAIETFIRETLAQ